MVTLFLVRQPVGRESIVTDDKGAQGYLGKLYFKGLVFDTIERAQGYVRLPLGVYQLEMFKSPTLGNVLRPVDSNGKELSGKRNKIRIHTGSIPSHVEGCIAPGFRSSSNNGLPLLGSWTAMTTILNECGSWENGKNVGSLFIIEDRTPPTLKNTAHLLEFSYSSLHELLKGL